MPDTAATAATAATAGRAGARDPATAPEGRRTAPDAAPDAALDRLCVNAIRTLSMDAVQAANSGHPGTAMAMAPAVHALWSRVLRLAPGDPTWPDRDRFVLSIGHASMLLYSALHLAGVRQADGAPAVAMEDIRRFRQLGSKCPGHPEYHLTTGVETTTGPLGQGVANAVGMAIAGRWLAARYDRPGHALFDHRVFALCGDGDMMEGVASEAASLAGHLKLSNLCWIYDSNAISIEGSTSLAFTEDVGARFEAYGWRVVHVDDANDVDEIERVLAEFRASADAPCLVIVRSTIAWGSPNKQGTKEAHGEPLGAEEIRLTKEAYGWTSEPFTVPAEVYEHYARTLGERGAAHRNRWHETFARYRSEHPELAAELDALLKGRTPDAAAQAIPIFPADAGGMAGRDASAEVLNAVAERCPWLVGGSADLAPSTKTRLTFEGAGDLAAETPGGRNVHFGVREHAMGSILNGMALSGLRAFGSGFLIFSDYMKPPIRLSSLMELPTVTIFTHDSIGVGEDGPTHQPVEQLVGLRAIPGLVVLRPGDANEVAEAWRYILGARDQPVCLVLSRQKMPTIDRGVHASADGLRRGGYVLACAEGAEPEVILIGTGSEVSLCLDAGEALRAEGIAARVVSMPSFELFERQDQNYRDAVLPPDVRARVAVEQASAIGWRRYVGLDGHVIGMESFGASAPLSDLLGEFGFTREAVVVAAKAQIARSSNGAQT